MTADEIVFGDDAPKQNPWLDDALGYRPFAERTAKVLLKLSAPEGYVIGLHGAWGSGKSTAINFIKAFLEKHNVEAEDEGAKIRLIDFRPWMVSGHQDLVAAFFKVFSEIVSQKKFSESVVGWTVKTAEKATDPIVDALSVMALAIDPSGGAGAKIAGQITKITLKSALQRFKEEPSLQAAYAKLVAALSESKTRFLVFIDDIDRLQRDEIRSVMQMVKTLGKLPNVIYFLAYDRDVVWQALEEYPDYDGPSFAEKIVQQELALPGAPRSSLLAILDKELGFVLGSTPNELRWHYIVNHGVYRWIRHPRDVQKLSNAIKFAWPALEGEIDPQDLFAMEGLKLFDSDVYRWIRWNKDFLFSQGRFLMGGDEIRTKEVERLLESLADDDKESIKTLLASLFPSRAKFFDKSSMFSEPHFESVKRRGIGTEAGYDSYFAYSVSPAAVSKVDVDRFIASQSDVDVMASLLEKYLSKKDTTGRSVLSDFLQEINFRYLGDGAPQPSPEVLRAVVYIAATAFDLDDRGHMFAVPARWHTLALIRKVLEAHQPQSDGLFAEVIQGSAAIEVKCAVFAERAREHKLLPSETDSLKQPVVSRRALDDSGKDLIVTLTELSKVGGLGKAKEFWNILPVWKLLAGPTVVKAWISENLVGSAKFTATVVMGLLSYSLGKGPREYTLRSQPDEDLYDLGVLRSACDKHAASAELDDDERRRLKAVVVGVDALVKRMSPTVEDILAKFGVALNAKTARSIMGADNVWRIEVSAPERQSAQHDISGIFSLVGELRNAGHSDYAARLEVALNDARSGRETSPPVTLLEPRAEI